MPKFVKIVGYKLVFIRKCNERNEITRYKAYVTHNSRFLIETGIDCKETYSPMMFTTTFRYLICLTTSEGLDMHLMDVLSACLYGFLDNDIYMTLLHVPEGFQMLEATNSKHCNIYSIKLQRSLYQLSNPKAYVLSEYLK